MTQCPKIVTGFTANVCNVFIKRLQTFFFLFFPTFLTFFNVLFKFLSERLLHMVQPMSPFKDIRERERERETERERERERLPRGPSGPGGPGGPMGPDSPPCPAGPSRP